MIDPAALEELGRNGWTVVSLTDEGRRATAELFEEAGAFHSLSDRRKSFSHHARRGNTEKSGGWYRAGEEPTYTEKEPSSLVEDFCVKVEEVSGDSAIWPTEINGGKRLRAASLAYLAAMRETALSLRRGLSSLVEEAVLCEPSLDGTPSLLRMLRYPTGGDALSAHTDFEIFTFVHQRQPGLEIFHGGAWKRLDAGASKIIILIGDVFEFWTNGATRAARHRVRCSPEVRRESIVLFHAAPHEAPLAPHKKPFCRSFLDAKSKADLHHGDDEPLTQLRHLLTRVHAAESNKAKSAPSPIVQNSQPPPRKRPRKQQDGD